MITSVLGQNATHQHKRLMRVGNLLSLPQSGRGESSHRRSPTLWLFGGGWAGRPWFAARSLLPSSAEGVGGGGMENWEQSQRYPFARSWQQRAGTTKWIQSSSRKGPAIRGLQRTVACACRPRHCRACSRSPTCLLPSFEFPGPGRNAKLDTYTAFLDSLIRGKDLEQYLTNPARFAVVCTLWYKYDARNDSKLAIPGCFTQIVHWGLIWR